MSLSKEDKLIRDSLSSVLQGYSVVLNNNEKFFIKHFGICDSIETDFQYQIAYDRCIRRKIYTEQEKIDFAIKRGLWSEAEDKEIATLNTIIGNLSTQKIKALLPSQKASLSKEIDIKQSELFPLLSKRNSLVGTTAESIASQRTEDYYIFKSFYFDSRFDKPYKTDDEFDEIEDDEMESLKESYHSSLYFILNGNIKKIALSNQFMSLMHLADQPYEILSKPLAQYTYYQMDLITYGKMYKSILGMEPRPPDNIRHDPDKLEDWFEKSTSSKKIIGNNNSDSAGKMVMGATPEDIKEIFKGEEVINVGDEIKKKGGMSMKEMMKLHGL